ncbi:MAG: TetR/AcrR family transcriptional regulator [Actinomycetota bacterium]
MARPREFDEAEVVDRARKAFWANGVAATSINALSGATGLSVGSIYKAFKSKDQLCSITLDDYLGRARAAVAETLDAGATPWEGIQDWLDAAIAQATDTSPTRGCYAVELATERAAVDEGIRAQLLDHDAALRRIVADAVQGAIDDGRLSGDADGVARLLCTTVNGLQVEARKGIAEPEARVIVDTMLRALEAA